MDMIQGVADMVVDNPVTNELPILNPIEVVQHVETTDILELGGDFIENPVEVVDDLAEGRGDLIDLHPVNLVDNVDLVEAGGDIVNGQVIVEEEHIEVIENH